METRATKRLKTKRDAFLAEIRKQNVFSEAQIKEYVDEAEHQDGYEYWDNFQNVAELLGDMRLYYQ